MLYDHYILVKRDDHILIKRAVLFRFIALRHCETISLESPPYKEPLVDLLSLKCPPYLEAPCVRLLHNN